MAFNLENMTIDYKKMLRMVPTDRATLAQSGTINDLIGSLTPGQLANLFPRYYREQLPDIGMSVSGGASLSGALSGFRMAPFSGRSGGNGTYAPYTPPPLSKSAQELAVEQILKENGIAPQEHISTVTGTTAQILATIRGKESAGDYTTPNLAGASSATGAYQFTKGTWQGLTQQFGIGTEYAEARFAPPEIQDQVAAKYVEDILRRHNGDVSWVPREWFAGPDGVFSAKEAAANPGQTVEGYVNDWMRKHQKNAGVAEDSEENKKKLEELQAKLVPLDEEVRKKLDPRTLEIYDKAGPEQKWNIEQAIRVAGVDGFNKKVESIAKTEKNVSATAQAVIGPLGKFDRSDSSDQFGITGTAAQRGLEDVDPRLVDIMKKASEEFPLRARLFSGKRDSGAHGKGLATDIQLFDESGIPLGSYKSPQTANIYAMFALKAREIQMRDYPELANDFVWAGGFPGMIQGGEAGGKYGAADAMDFRIGHSPQSAMQAFKWPSENDPGGWQPGYEQYTEGDFLGIGHNIPSQEDFKKLEGFRLTTEQNQIQTQVALSGGYNAGLLGHENIGERQSNQSVTYVSPGLSDTSDPVAAAQSNMLQPLPPNVNDVNVNSIANSTTSQSIPVPTLASGGTVSMTPGENIAGINTNTGQVEFMSNDRELYTKDDQGNLRVDPSTIKQEEPVQSAPADTQRLETANQPTQRKVQQPVPRDNPDPEFLETMTSGSMASSPSQLRALNRARLYSENSSNLINGHFS